MVVSPIIAVNELTEGISNFARDFYEVATTLMEIKIQFYCSNQLTVLLTL